MLSIGMNRSTDAGRNLRVHRDLDQRLPQLLKRAAVSHALGKCSLNSSRLPTRTEEAHVVEAALAAG